ncbi:MAG: hypothetical protein F9K13_06055 [Candidatus Methylomirabilis oxygeniifera]|uniref:Bacterial repeat domain-containing protein n=1 Tax=Methylomirabilis oxygeniifera TaxID=671143 RepID=D5MJU4_METO1|nr:MAG: hypothetical protein F9K13_06055 [Candidatus Methylomirabilis oxyfera]CBE67527.1 conserved exported protein of unknown function [Candidatus Methylomirabilis oxyfera]
MLRNTTDGINGRKRDGVAVARRTAVAVAGALLILLGTLSATRVYAAPGSLDPAFGTAGKVTTDFGRAGDASAVILQPDGKLVALGTSYVAGNSDFALARYNPDGSLDPTFGTGGTVTTDFGSPLDFAQALVLQPDGKLVAAGSANAAAGNSDFALARYNPNGTLDPTFGTGGKVTTDFGDGDEAHALVLQPDGKLVAAGYTDTSGSSVFALARYNSDGSLDPTFGTGGTVVTPIGDDNNSAHALIRQSDGKLVVAGSTRIAGDYDFALARYNPNGTLDPTFGTGGKVTTDLGSPYDSARALVLQPDGKLVVAGYMDGASQSAFALARYNPNGTLDPTFGTGGVVVDTESGDGAFALVLQPNNKLVAAGFSYAQGTQDFALARYNPNGTLDPTFGTGGAVTTDFGTEDGTRALVLQPDGKLVAAGWTEIAGNSNFALTRYEGDAAVLMVLTAGTGSGMVTSDVPGIDCEPDCKASYAQQMTVTLTAVADPGSVFAGYSGDPGCEDGIVTMNSDTTCIATFNLLTAGPDLTGTWRSLIQSCKGEGVEQKCKLKGKVQIHNVGTAKAPSGSFLRFYLSADPVWDGSDTLLQQVSVSSLKPGKTKSKKIKYRQPTSQTAKGLYLLAVLDVTGLMAELDETNNLVVFGPIP